MKRFCLYLFGLLHCFAAYGIYGQTASSTTPINKPKVSSSQQSWYQKSFEVMGTLAKVEFQSSDHLLAQKLLHDVVAEMHRIDHLMSPYKSASELSKLNKNGSRGGQQISKEMYDLLKRSEYFYYLTDGSFDVTFSSVGYLYNYRENSKPTNSQLTALAPSINFKSIKFSPQDHKVSFLDQNTKVDLGGIAKGHAVDRCIEILKNAGIKNAFVNAGGDSRVIGNKNDRLWYIGIRDPRNSEKLVVNLPLEEVAISTSGDYERFFIKDNIRYHHILDPKTGDSVRNTQSVTVLAPTSTQADALSTSVFVLGPIKGMALIDSIPEASAIIIDQKGKMTFSSDLVPAT